jgi:hypothetical protein
MAQTWKVTLEGPGDTRLEHLGDGFNSMVGMVQDLMPRLISPTSESGAPADRIVVERVEMTR